MYAGLCGIAQDCRTLRNRLETIWDDGQASVARHPLRALGRLPPR